MVPPSTVACALLPSALLTPRAKASRRAYLPLPRLPVNTRVQRAKLRQLAIKAFNGRVGCRQGDAPRLPRGPEEPVRDLEMEYFTDGSVYTRIGPSGSRNSADRTYREIAAHDRIP